MKQTSVEPIGRSQLIPGVGRTAEGALVDRLGLTIAAMALAVSIAAPVGADLQHKWAICAPADAQRVVAFEVLVAGKVISRWTFPVKPWAVEELLREDPPLPIERWFHAPDPF